MRSTFAQLSMGVVAWLWPLQLLAGGFSYPDLGTVPLSRGGSFVARADDLTAIWYNPAGLARLRGTHLLLNANIFSETIRFQRRIVPSRTAASSLRVPLDRYPHDPGERIPEIQNTDGPVLIPFLGVATDLGGLLRPWDLVLSAGLFGPNAHPSRTYPRYCRLGQRICEESATPTNLPGPGRYDTLSTRILVLNPTLGLSWRPTPDLSVGAVFQAAYAEFTIRKSVASLYPAAGQPREDPGQDIDVEIDAKDPFTPSGTFGVHWRAASFLELGASYQLPVWNVCEGQVRVSIPAGLDAYKITAEPNPASVELDLVFPMIVRGGVRYVHRDALGVEIFDVELNLSWEQTSQLKALVVKTDAALRIGGPGGPLSPIGELSQSYLWDDTWGIRLGGAYRLRGLLPDGALIVLRGGLFYESSAAPDAYLRLDFLPLARVGLTVGLGLEWGRWRLGLGYARLFHEGRNVGPAEGDPRADGCVSSGDCGSEAVVIVPIAPETGQPIGNGSYDMQIDMLTLGLSVAFDQ
jgi:long-subunit fatty acid transport protein